MAVQNTYTERLLFHRPEPLASALALFLTTSCGTRLPAAEGPTAETVTVLDSMVEDGEFPGAQYVALTAEHELLNAQVGVVDSLTQRPVERETEFLSYSVTKAMTAVLAVRLEEEGRLSLDEPLSKYAKGLPYDERITLKMLLAHTSGLPNPMPLDWFSPEFEQLDRSARLRQIVRKHPKGDVPEKSYKYTNLGYWLLEEALQNATKRDFGALLTDELWADLGPESESPRLELASTATLATGHTKRLSFGGTILGLLTPASYWQEPSKGWNRSQRLRPLGRAYGGLYTNASALGLVLRDLLSNEPRLISKQGRSRLFERQRTLNGKELPQTLGWVADELEGVPYFGKQGGGLGFHGNIRIYPSIGLGTVFLANRTELSAGPIDDRSDRLDAPLVRALRGSREP